MMKNGQLCFETVYDAYWLEIKRFVYVEARRDAESAEDIFQNTWENAFRYLHTLKDVRKVRAWLYAIARNEAKRHFAGRRPVFSVQTMSREDGEEIDVEDETAGLFPEALANEDLLIGLMNKLTDEEQQLILLHYGYDMRLNDIAGMYGVNYNSLKSCMRRTLRKLRTLAEGIAE
ncbi:MAG: RNA polymerase sigma factor [Clostridiales Family XIII bacterium]|jgi:RNA polymerase sigma-70 factor (ECF subfamily)|nr:RNA polymerase sigma factor [Clostridiales Family XIII bacterium]